MIKDTAMVHRRGRLHSGWQEEGLGPNTEIGSRLRALYGSVQEEMIPGHLLELLEKLDGAEEAQRSTQRPADTE